MPSIRKRNRLASSNIKGNADDAPNIIEDALESIVFLYGV